MHLLDKESGKMLNYCQLLRHPKYTEAWSLLSANEFGHLAQGVNGRIKGTDTIRFIQESNVPRNRRKDVTYEASCALSGPKKLNRTAPDSPSAVTRSIIQVKLQHQRPRC